MIKKIESYLQLGFNIFIDYGSTISYMNKKIFNEILILMKDEYKLFKKIILAKNMFIIQILDIVFILIILKI